MQIDSLAHVERFLALAPRLLAPKVTFLALTTIFLANQDFPPAKVTASPSDNKLTPLFANQIAPYHSLAHVGRFLALAPRLLAPKDTFLALTTTFLANQDFPTTQ